MSKVKDGGPAFPLPRNTSHRDALYSPGDGMSLRDYFAAKALEAFGYSDLHDRGVDGIALIAYEVADAMLRARAQEKQS